MNKSFVKKIEEYKELIAVAIPTAVTCVSTLCGNTTIATAIFACCGFFVAVLILLTGRLVKVKQDNKAQELAQKLLGEKARLEAQKSASFDYKMMTPIDSVSFEHLSEIWREKCRIDIRQMKIGDVRFCPSDRDGYVSIRELLDPDQGWNSSFSVAPMRNADKKGKCIVQVSYIPMDEDGKMPIILRMPHCHSSDVAIEDVQKAKLTFVSFSPVPLLYKRPFDVEECYHREVPDRYIQGVARKFEELGMAVRRAKDETYYLFYVFAVKYAGCSFADDRGNLNLLVVNKIFSPSANGETGDVEYFVKDHDKIVAAATATDIDYVIGSKENQGNASPWLRELFANKDYAVITKVRDHSGDVVAEFRDRFDMTTADLGAVEKKIIQKLMV